MKLSSFMFLFCIPLIIIFCLSADAGTVTTIDVPGATFGTFAQAINDFGAITGYYVDATDTYHGFLRTSMGAIISFDAPNSVSTQAFSINDFGVITGVYADALGATHAFLRSPQGRFTNFDVPPGYDTEPYSINLPGAVVGSFLNPNSRTNTEYSGFLRAPDGTITTFDAPGNGGGQGSGTFPHSINTLGWIAGYYIGSNVEHGFLRTPDGSITMFDVSGASGTQANSINDFGTITGFYRDSNGPHGYVRAPDGGITTFDAPGPASTSNCGGGTIAVSINDFGSVAGTYFAATTNCSLTGHGYVRSASGTFTTFDPAGSTNTLPQSINLLGAVTGIYVSSSGTHSFLSTP